MYPEITNASGKLPLATTSSAPPATARIVKIGRKELEEMKKREKKKKRGKENGKREKAGAPPTPLSKEEKAHNAEVRKANKNKARSLSFSYHRKLRSLIPKICPYLARIL